MPRHAVRAVLLALTLVVLSAAPADAWHFGSGNTADHSVSVSLSCNPTTVPGGYDSQTTCTADVSGSCFSFCEGSGRPPVNAGGLTFPVSSDGVNRGGCSLTYQTFYTATCTTQVYLGAYGAGPNGIKATYNGTWGTATSPEQAVTVLQPPTVAIAAPDVLGTAGDTLQTSGKFTDTAMTGSLAITANNTEGTFTASGDGTWSWSLPTTGTVSRKTITVTATDADGSKAVDQFDYEAATPPDTADPTVTDDVPATYRTTPISVTLTGGDTGGSGLASIKYTKGAAPADPKASGTTYTAPVELANGERISYYAIDGAGNESGVETSRAAIVLPVTNWFSSTPNVGSAGDGPDSIASGDFNGDGRPDLAAVSFNSDTLSVLIKNPGTGFTARPNTTMGGDPFYVAAGDLNGDGRDDIAIARINAGVRLYFQTSDGTGFTELTLTEGNVGPSSISIGDVNADGRPDLVTGNQYEESISVWLKDATGNSFTRQPANLMIGGVNPNVLGTAIGDVNGDGRPDIVGALEQADKVAIFTKDATGSGYTRAPDLTAGDGTFNLVIADFDLDGRNDIAAKNANAGTISVFYRDAVGDTFTTQTVAAEGGRVIATGDLTGDGRPDLVTMHEAGAGAVVLAKDASGRGFTRFYAKPATQTSPMGVAIADFDADGRPDLGVPNYDSDSISVLTGAHDPAAPTTTHAFAAPSNGTITVTLDPTDTGGSGVAVTTYEKLDASGNVVGGTGVTYSDGSKPTLTQGQKIRYRSMDNAGNVEADKTSAAAQTDNAAPTTKDDVPATYRTTGVQVTLTAADNAGGSGVDKIYYEKGTSPSDPTASSPVWSSASKPTLANGEQIKYRAADVAGNLEAVRTSRTLVVAAATNWFARSDTPAFSGPVSNGGIAVGDVNGDGRPDAVVRRGAGRVEVLLRTASGWAASPVLAGTVPSGGFSLTVGDVNGDGRADIVTADYFEFKYTVLQQKTDGTFDVLPSAAAPSNTNSPVIADLDNDGLKDIAFTGVGVNVIGAVFRKSDNSGFNGWTTLHSTGGGTWPTGLAGGDLNGDGRVDLVSANRGDNNAGNKLTVLVRNTQNTGWDVTTLISSGTGPVVPAIGDFDGDGRNDIVVTNISGSFSYFRRNSANAGFENAVTVPTGGIEPRGVAVGDVDGDGRPDLATMDVAKGHGVVITRNATNTGWDAPASVGHGATLPLNTQMADFDGDGRADLLALQENKSELVLMTAGRETTPPAVSDNVPTGATPAPFEVTLTATDDDSGVKEIRYTKGADPAPPTSSSTLYNPASKPQLASGERIRYFAVDRAFHTGNASTEQSSAKLVTDATPPTVDVDSPTAAQEIPRFATVNAEFSCDDETELKTCTADVDGTAITSGSALPTQTVGRRTLTVRAEDAAGNVETATRTFLVHGKAVVRDPGCLANEVPTTGQNAGNAFVTLPQTLKIAKAVAQPAGTELRSGAWISEDGLVGFDPSGYTAPRAEVFIANNTMTAAGASVATYGPAVFGGRPAFCVNWTGADRNGMIADEGLHAGKRNSFQMLLVDRSDAGGANDFDLIYNYDQIEWQPEIGATNTGFWGHDRDHDEPGHAAGGFLDTAPNGLVTRRRGQDSVDGRLRYAFRDGRLTFVRASEAAADELGSPEGSKITVTGKFTTPDGDAPDLTANNTQGTFTDNGDGTWKWTYTPPDDQAARTITVTAKDQNGESATDAFQYSVANVAPTVSFSDTTRTVGESRTAERTFTYTVSDPGDDTTTVETACGSSGVKAGDDSGAVRCVFKDGPASSSVTAKATDSDDATGAEDSVAVTIDNVAPTVTFGANDTDVDESGTDTHAFGYAISDPGDDTVTGVSTSCGAGGDKVASSDANDDASGSFKCSFLDGPASPVLTARATDSDNAQGADGTQTVTVRNVAPTLTSITAPTADAFVLKPQAWGFTGTDPSPVDQASLRFSVDWGDGKTSTAASPISHAWDIPGDFTVTARALDKDGALSDADTRPEYVGGSAIGAARSGMPRTLMIGGTSGADTFSLRRDKRQVIFKEGTVTKRFTLPTNSEIMISGGAGNDTITVDNLVIQKVIAFGNAGNDTLDLQNADVIAVGGAGNDELTGDRGRDLLVGGEGKDELEAAENDDVLVAGRIPWQDATQLNRQKLRTLSKDWGDKRASYAARIARLSTPVPRVRPNVLVAAGAGQTVFDDDLADRVVGDKLSGDTGRDWFLVNLSAPGDLDTVVDATGSETRTDLG